VGREDRGRLPLCSRDARVHARPSGGQLSEAPNRRFMPTAPEQTVAWASVRECHPTARRGLWVSVAVAAIVVDRQGVSLLCRTAKSFIPVVSSATVAPLRSKQAMTVPSTVHDCWCQPTRFSLNSETTSAAEDLRGTT
jgi:hypothetical protein